MSMDEPEETPEVDTQIYVTSFETSKLREPTNLELAEYIDLNNMAWFSAHKVMLIDRDVLHTPVELMVAQAELRAAQSLVIGWWESLYKEKSSEDGDEGVDYDAPF